MMPGPPPLPSVPGGPPDAGLQPPQKNPVTSLIALVEKSYYNARFAVAAKERRVNSQTTISTAVAIVDTFKDRSLEDEESWRKSREFALREIKEVMDIFPLRLTSHQSSDHEPLTELSYGSVGDTTSQNSPPLSDVRDIHIGPLVQRLEDEREEARWVRLMPVADSLVTILVEKGLMRLEEDDVSTEDFDPDEPASKSRPRFDRESVETKEDKEADGENGEEEDDDDSSDEEEGVNADGEENTDAT